MEREEPTLVHAFTGPPPGTVLLHKYRVDWTLGMGGFGLVLRAQHLTLDEPVAIKILRDDKDAGKETIERFLREAQAVVRLKSRHAIKVWDVGRLETGSPYIVMELLDGMDLGQLLGAKKRVSIVEAVDYVLQASEALAEAHSLGIIHRDIKPTNLFLARDRDGSELLKVLDFGISKTLALEELALTQTAALLGTPMYMSPEQLRSARSVDARSDLWSLGCVLYELVEGDVPFPAENFAELCVLVTTEPPPPMRFGGELEPIILRCLAKEPDARYRSIAELAADLERFASRPVAAACVPEIRRLLANTPLLGGARRGAAPIMIPLGTGSAFDIDETLQRNPPRRRSRALVVSLVAAVAVIGAVSIGFAMRGRHDPDPVAMPVQQQDPAPPPPVAATDPTPQVGSAAATSPPPPVGSAAPVATDPAPQVGSAAPPLVGGSAAVAPPNNVPHKPPVLVKPPVIVKPPVVKPKCDPYKSTTGSCKP